MSLYLLFFLGLVLTVRYRLTIRDFIFQKLRFHPQPESLQKSSQSQVATMEESFSRHEIYHAAFLLRQKLPPELVPEILDFAEYWLKYSWSKHDAILVSEQQNHERDGYPYLSSGLIGEDGLSGRHPVRKVVFEITSRDQGWSDHSQDHDTYRGSWTWFEAFAHDDEAERPSPIGRRTTSSSTATSVASDLEGIDPAPASPRAPSRELTRNVHAGKEYKTHTITWSADSEDQEEAKWVRELKRGQVIVVTAHARFPGWANHLRSAKIDIFIAAVR